MQLAIHTVSTTASGRTQHERESGDEFLTRRVPRFDTSILVIPVVPRESRSIGFSRVALQHAYAAGSGSVDGQRQNKLPSAGVNRIRFKG